MEKMIPGKRLTNYHPHSPIELGKAKINFTYKRDDFNLSLNPDDCFYLFQNHLPFSTYFLTNSGQVGISCILFHLKKSLNIHTIELLKDDAYTGTLEALNFLEIDFKKNAEILWICSSGYHSSFLNEIAHRSFKIVIIDNTCWHLQEEHYSNLLKKINAEIIIQVRSISKLDMHGEEYGSLGSVILSSRAEEKITKMSQDFKKIFKLFGAYPSLCDIPRELFIQEFFLSNIQRCDSIRKNTTIIKEALSFDTSLSFNFWFPDHLKYFFLIFDKFSENTQKQALLKEDFFFQLLNLSDIHFKQIKSFGFNFWNFDTYFEKDKKCWVMRICPSSIVSDDNAKQIIWLLRKYSKALNEFRN